MVNVCVCVVYCLNWSDMYACCSLSLYTGNYMAMSMLKCMYSTYRMKNNKHFHLSMYLCTCVSMDGWMDGWMDGCMYAFLSVCIYVCMYVLSMYTFTGLSRYVCIYT